ncbi:MAG: transcription-repair coupling factor [SAR202 cluster bacterium]|nr:transcription-repair coupling factor [SAR202 cluster bacterium]OUU74057.1 MAG: transcription-repair coupling factor [Chloroflexi bacterium TMED70]RZP16888.1 MAG: transcription-repair coupling factor [Chloroflexota bacterium]|tara:strand:+ start:690 stop:4172 length:3483 start_codon:yes stop_codon:yes gene_type:complete
MNLNNLVSLNGLLHNDHTFKDVVSEVRSNNNPKILSPKESHAFIISSIIQLFKKPILVISSNPEESRELVDNLNFWSTKTTNLNFNERNEIFLEKYKPDNKNNIERMRCLEALFMGQYGNKLPIICTSIQSITTNTISKDLYKDLSVNLSVGYKISQKELVEKLIFLGYQNSSIVESVGEFAIRGDILDIFTLNKKDPIRIDFLYDSIESIKVFQSSSQISYESLDNIFISPVSETNTFFRTIEDIKSINQEYFKNSNKEEVKSTISDLAKIISGESEELINYYSGFFDKNSVLDFLEDDYLVIKLEKYNLDLEFERINNRRNEVNKSKIENNIINSYFPTPYNKLDDLNERRVSLEINQRSYKNKKHYKLNFSTPKIHKFNQDKIKRYLNENEKNEKVIISTDYPSRVKEILGLNNVEIFDDIQEISNNKFNIVSKNIGQGFKINDGVNFFTVLTDKELFGMKKKRIIKSFSNNIPSTISSEPFKIDDFVVHIDHGIGKFIGTTQIDSTDREFIVLNYKNNDKLYVPSDQIDRIQLYKSFQKEDPSLDTLGSQRWIKSKNRVKKSIEILAVELLQIYAAREKIKGNSYKKSSDWYKVLEESFEFIETADQIKAINEINIDLMSNKPMDRLLCGDVGFGKTEVAIRAAFKVVENGYQVAILVPTTVLALQHYETFLERLKPFPIEIEYISRFISNSQQKNILEKLQDGKVDIIIGTHKLIQKNVDFNKLGMLIIDEEHKFGVNQKENIKQKEIDIDVLSLSATPIPRTLSLALNGVRDLSMINTAPENRIPVNTYLSEFSEDLIREVILRELDRKGQIFFVNNEVFNIEIIADQLKRIVPEAKVSIAHGQMDKNNLENIIKDFTSKQTDILVCTTIIESGIDMPNVNTLIVNNSHKFGLSQLYQMKGRIGRSEKTSYAYFLTPPGSRINEISEERLNAIISSSEFGSGYDIAMRDLEIRGAGNILGKEQSGHITSIGFELYNSLLKSAVESLKNGDESDLNFFLMNTVDIKVSARIPEDYIDDIKVRLNIYMRLSKLRKIEDLQKLSLEIEDRFGIIPEELEKLFLVNKIKILCHKYKHIVSIKGDENKIIIRFDESILGIKTFLEKEISQDIEIKTKTMIFSSKNPDEILEEIIILINKLINLEKEISEKFDQAISLIN